MSEPAVATSMDESEESSEDNSALEQEERALVEALSHTLEAIIFAAGTPITAAELKKICRRMWAGDEVEEIERKEARIKPALKELQSRWEDPEGTRGFWLMEVANGFCFRSNPAYAEALKATKEERPVRLSKAALETLSILAYRQPATKPEVDHIRGVDCGGTIKLLLERGLIRIVGKKEEPGRPLLYGTTSDFLSFFNIRSLNELPSLHEFHELGDESMDELEEFDRAHGIADLAKEAKHLNLDDKQPMAELDEAVQKLEQTESTAAQAFAEEGVEIVSGQDATKKS